MNWKGEMKDKCLKMVELKGGNVRQMSKNGWIGWEKCEEITKLKGWIGKRKMISIYFQ